MTTIHPTAVVDPKAELGEGVVVGPFSYVEAGAVLGDGCRLDSHVTVKLNTTLGARNFMGQGAVIGGDPQDRKFKGEPTFLKIGDDNTFREFVTIHRATGEGNTTIVGNNCFLMAFCHLGHNCVLHDDVTMANNAGCSGHVTVERLVTIGGMTGVHQFVRIGQVAMVGGMSRIVKDVPPFMIVKGDNEVQDINAVGLRRIGITSESRMALHKAAKFIFKSQLGLTHALEVVRREVKNTDEVETLIAFMERLFKGKNGRGDQP
ncbi:MAG: acyl-ACP--UDP-N-acetylglucosamine O-acyltransferase [Chthonomonas sp.]|nr:acyl-ACP--UDP-N-acetylglucosamine O-acyltransferase [Chthonomonas sp.]